MIKLSCKIFLIFVFIFGTSSFCFGGNKEGDKLVSKDTLSAIVITPNNSLYCSVSDLSGKKIISFIDSLLELDKIPAKLLKELKELAVSKHSEDDNKITLTNYYDSSPYPSNTTYNNIWNTKVITPYDASLTKNDTTLMLTLVDQKNNCNFISPIQNPVVTSNFGWRHGENHTGIDLDLQVWDPVVAAFDGMVRVAFYHPGYGRVVVIRHYNGLETLYAHLHRFKVKTGDIIEAGQVIGLGGSSGKSTGSHLHFEIRYKGIPLNPKHIISFKTNKLLSDSLELIKQKWDYAALPTGLKYHTIERGDFMYKIAKRYGMSVKELCDINGISRNKVLIVGKKLRIK